MHSAEQAATIIQQLAPNFTPKAGLVLGSGLDRLAESLTDRIDIAYSELPEFPGASVKGHHGCLSLGYLNNVAVACLRGRAHPYEGNVQRIVNTYVRTLKLLGCEAFIATNASGSLHEDMPPGSLMMIEDHINFQPSNPLVGPNDDAMGPRFLPLDNAYDSEYRNLLIESADHCDINLHHGVYISVLGPSFETAAEIRAFRLLGADAVGMSTVPEVIVANHCGLRVAAIATITNYATGLASTAHDHDEVIATADQAATSLMQLIQHFVTKL